jgi:phospholipid transport system transporter-binding protein
MPCQKSPKAVNETKLERVGAFHFQLHGEMTFTHAKSLLLQSEALFAGLPDVEIDMQRVEKADSAGLPLMLEWLAQAAERDARVLFTEVPEAIHSVARLCQIESLLSENIAESSTQ